MARVKRFESGVLRDPITITPDVTVRQVRELSHQHGISGFPVLEGQVVVGIVTNRDMRFETRLDAPVREIMTPRERLVTVGERATLADGKALMHRHKLERVLVVNDAFELKGCFIAHWCVHPTGCRTSRRLGRSFMLFRGVFPINNGDFAPW